MAEDAGERPTAGGSDQGHPAAADTNGGNRGEGGMALPRETNAPARMAETGRAGYWPPTPNGRKAAVTKPEKRYAARGQADSKRGKRSGAVEQTIEVMIYSPFPLIL